MEYVGCAQPKALLITQMQYIQIVLNNCSHGMYMWQASMLIIY